MLFSWQVDNIGVIQFAKILFYWLDSFPDMEYVLKQFVCSCLFLISFVSW